jgi:hypothetical protein
LIGNLAWGGPGRVEGVLGRQVGDDEVGEHGADRRDRGDGNDHDSWEGHQIVQV